MAIRQAEHKIGVMWGPRGCVSHIPREECLEVLRRMYVRNMDQTSCDFEALTEIQRYALYQVLLEQGVPVGNVKVYGHEEESDVGTD